MSDREQPFATTTTRAREGVTGHNVRYVLATSLVLLAIVFGGVWLYYFT